MRPVYVEKSSPCQIACPAGENIPAYFELVRQKKYREAWYKILEDNPLPGVTGRVCYHPCEGKCNRSPYDEPVAVHVIERFIADKNFREGKFPSVTASPKSAKVAVVGSGPAGLSCAYQLARKGYRTVIYEGEHDPGGMLRYGIPSYRLPKNVLAKEINDIASLGVQIRTDSRIGGNVPWSELEKYDAVFVAVGASQSSGLGIDGEKLTGVYSGVDLLHQLNTGGSPKIGSGVVVIGGGNTAIDAARSAVRLGKEVTVLYRRTRDEMPAVPDEVNEALREGVRFEFLVSPVKIKGRQRKVTEVDLIRMKLGEPDESGRRRPLPIEGSNFEITADTVVAAVGETPDLSFLPYSFLKKGARIFVDADYLTGVPGIFAGGDSATNPNGTVVNAIKAGKEAAASIDEFLGWRTKSNGAEHQLVKPEDINTFYFPHETRIKVPRLSVGPGTRSFAEVNKSITEERAFQEAERCFSCGSCLHCDVCMTFCPDVAISKDDQGEYIIDYDHCKGCGICVNECPREAMDLVEEDTQWA